MNRGKKDVEQSIEKAATGTILSTKRMTGNPS